MVGKNDRRSVNWSSKEIGCWRVLVQDPSWGEIPISLHPDNEDIARWVASNNGVDCIWIKPSN